jgi:GGDEF domain-containing protein
VAYLQVRHADPIGFELRIAPATQLEQRRQIEYLVLGIMLGCLVLLTVSFLSQAAIHRDPNYAWYAVYAAAMTLTIATVTGVSGHLLWNESPRWTDAAQGALPVMLAGIHVLFLRHLCGIASRYPKVARAALASGVAIVVLSLAYLVADERWQGYIVACSMITGVAFGAAMSVLAWRRRDAVGGWVIVAYAPISLVIVVAILRLYGWIAATWLTLDASAAAAALAVPLLLLALNARSRDRHGVRTRVNKLTEQDALTGLLSPYAFERQLKAAVSGALMRREAAAVVVVEIVNLPQIRKVHGDATAEQSLLRAVIKLHRVIRDSDPAGRIATAHFGLIFEGIRSRAEVQARMVRLVASGLVPNRGAKLDVPLQFHATCLMLGERVLAPALILRDLCNLLARMSRRSRRPVRFLEADTGESSLPSAAGWRGQQHTQDDSPAPARLH